MDDPGIEKLRDMQREYEQHKARIAERAKEIRTRAESGEADLKELWLVMAELFDELHDTALSFQSDLVSIIREDWESTEEEEEEDDGAEPEEEFESLLLPGDADEITRALQTYLSMLDQALTTPGIDEQQSSHLRTMRAQAKSTLELVESITFDPDAEGDEQDAPEDATEAGEPPASTNTN